MYDVLVTGAKQRSVLRDLSDFYIVMSIGFYRDNIRQKTMSLNFAHARLTHIITVGSVE